MAKYTLVQIDESKKVKEIPILFNSLDSFRNLNKDNLKDIIKFTGLFKSQSELNKFLKKHKLVKNDGNFDIIYRYGGENKHLKYGITYREDLIFFNEINMKKFTYQNNLDCNLINELCNFIENKPNQKNNIKLLKKYLNSENFGIISRSDESYLDYLIALDKIIETECFQKGSNIENFERLRDLAMFFSNQYKNNENLKFNAINQNNEIINYVEKNQQIVSENTGKQKKKQRKVQSQLSYIF